MGTIPTTEKQFATSSTYLILLLKRFIFHFFSIVGQETSFLGDYQLYSS